MITDEKSLAYVRECWESVRNVQQRLRSEWFANGVQVNEEACKEAYNLPFVLAYSVLDEVLLKLYKQGEYICAKQRPRKGRPFLGEKMEGSKKTLPWQDFDLVDAGRNERNLLAHEACLVEKPVCLKYINAIEAELKAWKILD